MKVVVKIIKWIAIVSFSLVAIVVGYSAYLIYSFDTETLPENYGQVNQELFLGEGENQPLIVGFGGAEGGNAWASDYWKPQRDRFIEQGYAFLALGYFGEQGVPKELDRISLDAIHATIMEATENNPQINGNCIALIGASKGAELSLVLASHYPEIKSVVGVVPGHAVFAGLTFAMNTASFTLNDEQLPFVPVPWSATPALLAGDLRAAWVEMLKDQEGVEKAAIAIENINGPVFLLSGTTDELWPSTEMSELMVQRFANNNFPHHYEHVAIEGGHTAPQKHLNLVEDFLSENFLKDSATDCAR